MYIPTSPWMINWKLNYMFVAKQDRLVLQTFAKSIMLTLKMFVSQILRKQCGQYTKMAIAFSDASM